MNKVLLSGNASDFDLLRPELHGELGLKLSQVGLCLRQIFLIHLILFREVICQLGEGSVLRSQVTVALILVLKTAKDLNIALKFFDQLLLFISQGFDDLGLLVPLASQVVCQLIHLLDLLLLLLKFLSLERQDSLLGISQI